MTDIIKIADTIQGWMSVHELATIYRLTKNKKIGIEIGCFCGRSAKVAVHNLDLLICVDPFTSLDTEYGDNYFSVFCKNLSAEIKSGKILILPYTSNNAIQYINKLFGKGFADYIFIDGDHTPKQIKKDIKKYLPCLKPDGVISGHDYNQREIKEAVNSILSNVKQTLDDNGYISPHDNIFYVHKNELTSDNIRSSGSQ
jgi:predicted O-methyltransferase YrrM